MRIKNCSNKLSKNHLFLLAHLIIFLYYLPYFLLGEDAHILIHDNLDSNVTWIKILMNNSAIFANPSKVIDQVLNGIPVYSVYGTYDISLVTFKCFGLYLGYIINKLTISIIGFWGMFLLLRKHFLISPKCFCISTGVSLIFSLLPFWSFSASVLGLPFLLFAFLNLRNRNFKFYNFLIIIVIAFYSSLILSGIFFLIVLFILFLHDIIKDRKINWIFFCGLSLLSISYLISHLPLIYGFLFDTTTTHRVEFYKNPIGFNDAINNSILLFIKGQYHAHSLHILFAIPVTLIFLVWHNSFNRAPKLILGFIILTSLFYGFHNQYLIKPITEQITSIIPIHVQRFYFLHPMLWYILLAIVLGWLSNRVKYSNFLVFAVLILQLFFVVRNHEVWVNRKQPSFEEFYSERVFDEIKSVIGRPVNSYKVISVGLHPAIVQYNGFNTLDGYFLSYPLEYKHEFRRVIGNELARDESLKAYFDNWATRCYAFSSEIGREYVNNKKDPINYLKYDFQHLRNMGCDYIFSATSINELLNPQLKQIKVVTLNDSYWKIYLYEIR